MSNKNKLKWSEVKKHNQSIKTENQDEFQINESLDESFAFQALLEMEPDDLVTELQTGELV